MTNYCKYKIVKIRGDELKWFELDGYVDYKYGHREKEICFFNRYHHFNSFQVGDYVEIDLDKTLTHSLNWAWESTSMIRKVSSSAVVPNNSSQQMTTSQFQEIGNQMMDRVERSDGQMEAEWIARVEYRTNGSVSAQEIGWKYRYK